MTVSLLIAPAAHGKTEQALALIREARAPTGAAGARPGLAPIAVILPNQVQRVAFRERLAAAGGAIGVTLYTFYGLYAELLARAGQPLPELDGGAQTRLLRVVIGDLASRGRLHHFAPLRDKPGFAAVLREAIEELKRARVSPEDFERATRGLGSRLEELAALYASYQRWLLDHRWADPEGLGWLGALALERDPALGADLRLLVVDGFDEFNPTQLAVLTQLAARAQECLITLTGDPHRQRLAQRRFQRAEQQLLQAAGVRRPAPVEASPSAPTAHVAGDLARLEAYLFEAPRPPAAVTSSGAVVFLEAQTRAAEARAALRWIKQCLVHDGLAPNEVAVLARSIDAYRPFLEETAREFGLPLRLVGGAPLAESSIVGALLSLLALPAEPAEWRPRDLLTVWRSPYFDWAALGLDAAQAATLDAVSRLGRVVQGLEQWREALRRVAAPSPAGFADEAEAELSRPAPEAVSKARAAFEAFIGRLRLPARAPLPDYVAFVENLIGDEPAPPWSLPRAEEAPPAAPALNLAARALAEPQTAARDMAALRTFKDVLRGLVLSETLVADRSADWDYAAFVYALQQAVEGASFQTPLPHFFADDNASPDEADDAPRRETAGITVAAVLDARGLSFRAAAILGLAEGEFPLAEREMPLLREADRAALRERGLPLEPRLRGDEVTIFYEAVTRARERLLLCRPYLADDGQPWEPSAYWRQARRLMGEPPIIVARPEDRLAPQAVASPAEWVEQGYAPDVISAGVAVLRARQARQAGGLHEGQLPDLAPLLAARFPATQSWSASRLEAYGACGFYFYVAHVLKLEPHPYPEEGFDMRALGGMYHAIRERLYRGAPNPADLNDLLERLPAIALAVFADAPEEYGFRPTALWEQQQAELIRVLRDTVTALAEKAEGWTPRYFEQRFGFGETALIVPTEHGAVRLHGYIDRVDVDDQGRLRIVDYKASGSPITAADLQQGHRLQLPLYALAARDALRLGEVAEGFYWHIGKAEASSLKLEKFEGGVAGAFDTARQHLAAHLAGILGGSFQPTPPEGGCPRYCPAIGFCWRYQSRSF